MVPIYSKLVQRHMLRAGLHPRQDKVGDDQAGLQAFIDENVRSHLQVHLRGIYPFL